MSLELKKKVNSIYSFSTELVFGNFAGLRQGSDYSGYNVFDPFTGNYEGGGDKFITSFSEADLLLNINLSKLACGNLLIRLHWQQSFF